MWYGLQKLVHLRTEFIIRTPYHVAYNIEGVIVERKLRVQIEIDPNRLTSEQTKLHISLPLCVNLRPVEEGARWQLL